LAQVGSFPFPVPFGFLIPHAHPRRQPRSGTCAVSCCCEGLSHPSPAVQAQNDNNEPVGSAEAAVSDKYDVVGVDTQHLRATAVHNAHPHESEVGVHAQDGGVSASESRERFSEIEDSSLNSDSSAEVVYGSSHGVTQETVCRDGKCVTRETLCNNGKCDESVKPGEPEKPTFALPKALDIDWHNEGSTWSFPAWSQHLGFRARPRFSMWPNFNFRNRGFGSIHQDMEQMQKDMDKSFANSEEEMQQMINSPPSAKGDYEKIITSCTDGSCKRQRISCHDGKCRKSECSGSECNEGALAASR